MFTYGGGGSLNKLDSTRKKIRIHFDITVLVASGQKNYRVPRKKFNDGASHYVMMAQPFICCCDRFNWKLLPSPESFPRVT